MTSIQFRPLGVPVWVTISRSEKIRQCPLGGLHGSGSSEEKGFLLKEAF